MSVSSSDSSMTASITVARTSSGPPSSSEVSSSPWTNEIGTAFALLYEEHAAVLERDGRCVYSFPLSCILTALT